MRSTQESYPTSASPEARFDAIVARGEQIRRRDRFARRAVTGGAAAAVVVVVLAVAALVPGSDRTQGPASGTGARSTTSTTVVDQLTVHATASKDAVEVRVDDPALPATPSARLCARIRIQPEGPAQVANAAAEACWSPSDGDATTVEAVARTRADVGCAATVDRTGDAASPSSTASPSATSATAAVTHGFRFELPADLPAGVQIAEVTVVSSTNDGCETSSPQDDDRTATTSVSIHRG